MDEIENLRQRQLEGKKEMHRELTARSFTEKIKILEKLRDRDRAVAAAGLRGKAEQSSDNKELKESKTQE